MRIPADTGAELPRQLRERLSAILGARGVVEGDCSRYHESWGGSFTAPGGFVVRPGSTAEVAGTLAACAEARVAVVPQGGNTGLAGGAQPTRRGAVIVSLERMRALRAIDPVNDTITVEAGMTLAELQARAAEVDRLFPLSLASEGSCQIGGNLSTNAGGTQCLRYGNARAMALGLEVVLPDGQVWDGLRGLRKDATGYDLKQLFIGAEGTLGIITAAVLRLLPRPRDAATAFAAVPDPEAALRLLDHARRHLGESLTAFELMRHECLAWALVALGGTSPFAACHPWYVLIEATGQSAPGTLALPMEESMAAAIAEGIVSDATLAASETQRRRLWAMREGQAEAQKAAGPGIKHDVSVPVSAVPDFLARADAALAAAFPMIRPFAFGHLGDGNIHYNPLGPAGSTPAEVARLRPQVNRIVHDIVVDLGGSISAEHGLGQLRTHEIQRYKAPVERAMMAALKATFDPKGLMNPGKIVPD
ncbi:FAD-binding oxidoreductase [Methylobacterium sp. R2-1]|uniref:FAD-binding oxidoreductase n=1 Tax=Methylobacterium sp. R2-1 TaxID=2587064 RepID=UPI0017E37948|nr:FAD-binding oxidoreductase [Methylobacterium sp. R2-1]MBB2963334.1 FAD/FMN-containing dehydrogenase [Methylobacterium sp. R2-1]